MLTLLTAPNVAHLYRVLVAALALLEASYVCPALPVHVRNPHLHLREYQGTLSRISSGRLAVAGLSNAAQQAGARLLATALNTYFKAAHPAVSSDAELLQAMRQLQQAARLLERPEAQQQLSRAMTALSAGRPEGQPPFTLQQLQYGFYDHLILMAVQLCVPAASEIGTTTALACLAAATQMQRPSTVEASAVARSAASALARLEAGNPRTLEAAAQPLLDGLTLPQLATVQQLLSAVQQARERRSELWAVRLTCAAVLACTNLRHEAGPAVLRALQQLLQQAEAALSGCQRLLPRPWVSSLQARIPFCQNIVQSRLMLESNTKLARDQAEQRGDQAAAAAALSQAQASTDQLVGTVKQHDAHMTAMHACAGCRRSAVGLRTCARCRTARYCSRECQAAHWPQHKRECRPA